MTQSSPWQACHKPPQELSSKNLKLNGIQWKTENNIPHRIKVLKLPNNRNKASTELLQRGREVLQSYMALNNPGIHGEEHMSQQSNTTGRNTSCSAEPRSSSCRVSASPWNPPETSPGWLLQSPGAGIFLSLPCYKTASSQKARTVCDM